MILTRAQTSIALLGFLALSPALPAQLVLPGKGETLPTFEVATVKPSSRDLGRSFHIHIWWNDNTYSTENTTLRDLIRTAFHISNAQLSGGPEALLDSRFDISAKISDEDYANLKKLPRDDFDRALPLMMQALLADRFGLKFHTETRELPVFDLVVDKSGSKLQAVTDPPPEFPGAGKAVPGPAAAKPSGNTTVRIGRNEASMSSSGGTLASLVAMLERQSELDGRIVIDKTSLTGRYSYSLKWSPQRLTTSPDPGADGPSLFTALKEQLGLRLESSKGPVPVIVIDAVSDPTPN